MRQRNWFIANLTILVCLSAWLLCSCSDDPQAKTVKHSKQKTYDALTQLDAKRDPNTANRYFQESLQSRPGGEAQDAATMASTNLLKTQTAKKIASYRITSLSLKAPLNSLADELKMLSDKTSQLQRTNNLLTLADDELLELQNVLAGQDNPDSLVAKCAAAKTQMEELTAKQNAYQKEYDSALAIKLDIENQAEQQLRLAESLKDADQKAAAEKKRFDLLSQRIQYDIQVQDAENKLGQVASQMAIVAPYLAQLEQDRRKTETRIEILKNSESRSHLLTLSQDLRKEIGQLQDAVVQRAAQLKIALDSNTSQFEERMAELAAITEQYQSVRSRQWAFLAAMSLGDAYASTASICAVRIMSLLDLGTQYEGLMLTYDAIVPDSVKKMSLLSSKADAALLQKANDSFDAADKAYLEAFDMADQNGRCVILKARLLTLKEKLLLSDRLDDFDAANKTQSAMDELTKSAPDICDQFALSTTSNLVAKGIGYIPSPQVNMAMIIESIQKEFAQWRSFRGSQQEAEVNKLASRIDQLKAEFPGDTQLAQFLDQESKAMEAARTRGFAAEAVAENGDPNAIGFNENSEPNGVDAGGGMMQPMM